MTSQSRGRRCRRGTRKVTKPCGRIYGCHMELRQQNNGFNVEDHPPISPTHPVVYSPADDTLPSRTAYRASGCTHTFISGQNILTGSGKTKSACVAV